MPYIKKPIDRDQYMMTTLDSMVEWNSIARVLDCFVERLDMEKLGFARTVPSTEGRPCYDEKSMLKLYLYGYRKNIRSSRKLEAACSVNIEVMWLMGGLKPDFKTIADFRKDNIDAMKGVFKEFHRRVTVELETGFVSIDGSKFKAWNSKDRNFTIMKLDDRIKWLENHTQEYLRLVEDTDWEEGLAGNLTKEELEAKLKEAEERLAKYRSYRELMEKENLTQLSLTDAEARLMKNKNGMEVSYNVQTAVDSETHMIRDYQMTNQVTDHGLMASTAGGIKKEAGEEILQVVTDKGYKQDEDMVACLEKGIVPNVILPDGQDAYKLETEYREVECDPSGRCAEEISRCLHAGIIPEAYKDVIDEMEVVEVRRKAAEREEAAEPPSPYGTEEEMKERAAEGFYVRDPERDLVYCPGGAVLRKKCIKKSGATRYANKHACSKCPYRDKCLTGKQKWKELDFGKDSLEKEAKWGMPGETQKEEGTPVRGPGGEKKGSFHYEKIKVVRFRLKPDRKKMEQRKSISEHPFGTIKRAMGAAYFLLKGKRKVSGEFALMATGYNLSRAENMFRFEKLMEMVGTEA